MNQRPVLHLGEVAGVANTLVTGLVTHGVPAEHHTLPHPAAKSGTLVKTLGAGPRLSAASRLRRDIHQRGAIAHVHFATSALFFSGIHPLVVHCHGSDVRHPKGTRKLALSRIFQSADILIAATPDLLDHLPSRARYLPNPVDLELFHPSSTPQDAEHDVLIFAGLTDVKGAPELLAIVQRLRQLVPRISISAINHGPHARSFAAAGVRMVEYMESDQLPEFICSHRLVLGQRVLGIPGTSELQAMACGRAVVMPLTHRSELWDNPPAVAEPDPDRAAHVVAALLEDPTALAELGTLARQWVVSNHDVDHVIRRLAGWYEEFR